MGAREENGGREAARVRAGGGRPACRPCVVIGGGGGDVRGREAGGTTDVQEGGREGQRDGAGTAAHGKEGVAGAGEERRGTPVQRGKRAHHSDGYATASAQCDIQQPPHRLAVLRPPWLVSLGGTRFFTICARGRGRLECRRGRRHRSTKTKVRTGVCRALCPGAGMQGRPARRGRPKGWLHCPQHFKFLRLHERTPAF